MSRLLLIASSAVSIAALAACGALDFGDDSRGPYYTGTGNYGQGGSGNAQGGFGLGGEGAGGSGGFNYSEHCGGGCVPATNEAAEECLVAGDGGGGGAPSGGGMGGDGGVGGDAGMGGAPVTSDCKLVVDARGSTMGECSETASGSDVCLSASDCGPGQGCVLEGMSGTCRPYCCGDVEACPVEQYCALRPLAGEDLMGQAPREIPVCVPAVDCELLNDTTCAEPGTTCTIVRRDGTESCVPPGSGVAGDACPCDQGHFCDTAANRCLKICRVDDPATCPAGYLCQGGTENYPPEFGGCVAEL